METSGLRVVKGHGTRNDFVLLLDPDGQLDLTPELVRALCDRRGGVGGDGVLRVVRSAALGLDGAEWFMDYRNADGSVAEMCGNGVRVYARFLVQEGLVAPGRLEVATRDGVKEVHVPPEGDVSVDMGVVTVDPRPAEVVVGERTWPAVAASIGNPHAVVLVESLADAGPLREAPELRPAERFPTGANVEFVVLHGPGALSLRVHERGVGETQACGTGVCAAVAVVAERAPASEWTVTVPGGRLEVELRADGHVVLRGPAEIVADARLDPGWLSKVTVA